MIWIFCTKQTEEKHRVEHIHYKPEKLSEEEKNKGFLLNISEQDLPNREDKIGQSAVLYFNPKTKDLWTEYFQRSLTQEEILIVLLQKMERIEQKLDSVQLIAKDGDGNNE